jgi:hypothetical protein
MSVLETPMGGRRAAARDAAETRKKLLLAGLAVVLVALLAFELPKIMKRSSSSSSTASTSVATTANPAVTFGGSTPLTAAEAKRLRLIRRLEAKDPFVPLIRESTSTSLPAHAVRARHSKPGLAKPVHVKPTAPAAAVIRTNGQRQVVGLSQVFNVGDAKFRLVAVTRKAMRIKVIGGVFAGGKQGIRVRKGHPLKLANSATGVQYRLLFTAAASSVLVPTNANGNS